MRSKLRMVAVVGLAGLLSAWVFFSDRASSGFTDQYDTEWFFLVQASDGFNYRLNSADRFGTVGQVSSKGIVGRPAISRDGAKLAVSGILGEGDLGRYQLYTMDADGSNLTQLTTVTGADLDPAWSPNGKEIAYSRDDVGNLNPANCCDIWIVNADGTNARRVTNTQGGRNPTWSPDGSLLAFETPSGLFTITPNGSNLTQVAAAGAREPAWAPSGDEIAFVRSTNASESNDELVVLTLASSSESAWYEPGSRIEAPSWVGDALYVVTYNGYGYDGRVGSRVRLVRPSGAVSTVFNPSPEVVFVAQALNPCYGMFVGGELGGGPGIGGVVAPGDCFGHAVAVADFDGDSNGDALAGVPGDREMGAINAIYGSGSGLTSSGDQIVDQQTSGIMGTGEDDDRFGYALAVGDFNDDGFDDAVVGVPGEDVSSNADAGAVNIIYGSGSGLTSTGDQLFDQGSAGVPGTVEEDDRTGEAVAVGDFDGDGFDDVAIGVPGEDIQGLENAGAVIVLMGSVSGITTSGAQLFDQGAGIKDHIEADDRFGAALATGDLDSDGFDDLVVGVPGEGVDGKADAGMVNVLYGSGTGLTTQGDQSFNQAGGIKDIVEKDDRFGESVAIGDFDDDGFDDLVVGAPGEGVDGRSDAGRTHVIYGTPSGLTRTGDQRFSQGGGVKDQVEADDRFGESVAVGDIDGDGFADLVVGVPGEGVNGNRDAGMINVLFGTATGVTRSGDQKFTQAGGVKDSVEVDDRFGESVAVGDIDDDGFGDVVVGVPGEGVGGMQDAGLINVLFGTAAGVTRTDDQRFSQDS